MRRLSALAAILILATTAAPARADVAAPVDPQIVTWLTRVDAARLRATDERLVAFGTRSTFSENLGPQRGYGAASAWVEAQFRAIARTSRGRLTVARDEYEQPADGRRVARAVRISSVVATLRGDDGSGRTYVMSSHLDSRNSSNEDAVKDAPGADDNGSAVSAVLEAARVLAAAPALHATVIFACYDAEEQGLFGSGHHAKTLKAAGVDVAGDLNNDIIGASVGDDGVKRDDQVRIFSEALPPDATRARINTQSGENDSPSRELARFAKTTGDAYGTGLTGALVFRADRYLRGGDHESFNDAGYAAIRFVEPVEDFRHQHQDVRVENGVQYGDLARYVDFAYLARVTRYNMAVLASLALAPAAPVAQMDGRMLSNSTTLAWAAVPRAVRYEVVRRETSAAEWTDVSDVGNVTTVTVPFSKDRWLFGVRSVDAQGHRSVAAFPALAR